MQATIKNLLWILSCAAAIVIALCTTLLLLGYRPFVVQSPSMQPTFSPGDLVFANVSEASTDAHIGDVVIYRSPAGSLVMHRLVGPNTLQGDANELAQHVELNDANFVGIEAFHIPGFGLVVQGIKTLPWLPWAFVGLFLVLACIPWEHVPLQKVHVLKSSQHDEAPISQNSGFK